MIQFNVAHLPILFKGYGLILPEALLIVAAAWALFCDRLPGRDRGAAIVAAVLVVFAGLITGFTATNTTLFGSGSAAKLAFTTDSRFGGVALCVLALIWLIWTAAAGKGRTAEAVALACLSLAGTLLMLKSADLIVLLLSLELAAMPVYVLIGYRRKRASGLEGALKYFLLSLLTSLFLFYGASFIFSLAGTSGYAGLSNIPKEPIGVLALIFLLIGIFAKMSVAPFHFWAPDAYAGAESWSVAFAAALPKTAVVFVLARLMLVLQGQPQLMTWILLIVAVTSMVVGSFAALTQKEVRRMMAYSGVVNMGYVLLAFAAVGTQAMATGFYAALFFAVAYSLPMMGILLITASEGDAISSLAGLSRRRPLAAFCLVIFVLSLIGVPPLMGFFGKFLIAASGIAGGKTPFIVVMMVVSVISAFYYLRLLKAAFFDKPEGEEGKDEGPVELPDALDGAAAPAVTAERAERAPVPVAAEIAILLCAVLVIAAGPASSFIMAWLSNPPY